MQFSEQLVRIDIDRDGYVFGERQFVERLAHQAAQTHNGCAAHQNVKPELTLQLLDRRGCRLAQNEFRAD